MALPEPGDECQQHQGEHDPGHSQLCVTLGLPRSERRGGGAGGCWAPFKLSGFAAQTIGGVAAVLVHGTNVWVERVPGVIKSALRSVLAPTGVPACVQSYAV